MSAAPLLAVTDLNKSFGGLRAVSDLNLAVLPCSIHSLIGPNGAGKTTAFNCIAQFVPLTSGSIHFENRRIDGLKPDQIAARGVARTYQNTRLFRSMTALDNVLIGRHRHLKVPWWGSVLSLRGAAREELAARSEAERWLGYAGLTGAGAIAATALSYGQQRRLEIARALATEPKLLMLDEPTAGMNPAEIGEMVRFIRRLRDELSLTILLIEHQVKLVMAVSDRVTVLDHGVMIAEGCPADVQRDPHVIAAYLGRHRVQDSGQAATMAPR